MELNEKAVKILSPYTDLPLTDVPSIDLPVDSPAPAKCRMTRADLLGILLTIFFGIAGLIQNHYFHEIDSREAQQEQDAEAETQQQLFSYFEQIIDLLEHNVSHQESVEESLSNQCTCQEASTAPVPSQESADSPQESSVAVQTVPDESDAPDTDEQ